MFHVFTRMPGGVTVRDSGLCRCCVPCLLTVLTPFVEVTEQIFETVLALAYTGFKGVTIALAPFLLI